MRKTAPPDTYWHHDDDDDIPANDPFEDADEMYDRDVLDGAEWD